MKGGKEGERKGERKGERRSRIPSSGGHHRCLDFEESETIKELS